PSGVTSHDSATPGAGSSERASSRVSPSKMASATRPSGSPVMMPGSSDLGSEPLTRRKSARPRLDLDSVRPTTRKDASSTKNALIRLRRIVVQVAPRAVLGLGADQTRFGHDRAAGLEDAGTTCVKQAAAGRVQRRR